MASSENPVPPNPTVIHQFHQFPEFYSHLNASGGSVQTNPYLATACFQSSPHPGIYANDQLLAISGLLIHAAFDWARESLGSAPAVAPGVRAFVLPLRILTVK